MKEETCCTIYQYNCDIIVGYFSLQINCIVGSSSPSIGQLLLICVSNQNSQCPFLHFIQGKAYLPGSCSIKQESTNTSAETSLFLQMSEFLLANYTLKKFVGETFMPKKPQNNFHCADSPRSSRDENIRSVIGIGQYLLVYIGLSEYR